jgi:predicted XRE-type DNA-binding protein
MHKSKIDNDELFRLVKLGKSQSEIAAFFGVQSPAVSKRLKKLNIAISRDIVMRSAPAIVDRSLKAMDQLAHINSLINRELDHIEQESEGKFGADRQATQDARLRHVAELRKQLALLLEIQISDYNIVQAGIFQQELLDFLDELEPGLRARFLNRLTQKNMMQSTISIPGGIRMMKENGQTAQPD